MQELGVDEAKPGARRGDRRPGRAPAKRRSAGHPAMRHRPAGTQPGATPDPRPPRPAPPARCSGRGGGGGAGPAPCGAERLLGGAGAGAGRLACPAAARLSRLFGGSLYSRVRGSVGRPRAPCGADITDMAESPPNAPGTRSS